MLAPSAPLAVCLCTALHFTSTRAPGSPTLALAVIDPAPPPVEVDASALDEGGDVVGERVQQGCEEALGAADLELDTGSESTIRVSIAPLEGGTPGYRIRYEAVRDGQVVEQTAGTTECRMCTESELVEQVGSAVVRVAQQIPPPQAEPTPAPAPTAEPTPTPTPAAPDSDRGAPLGTLGKAGIGLIVPGAVSLAIGIGLAAKKPERIRDMPTHRINTRPPGIALAVGGTAVAMAGVVLLVLDRRRARRRTAARRPVIAPMAGADDRFGVVLTGRF